MYIFTHSGPCCNQTRAHTDSQIPVPKNKCAICSPFYKRATQKSHSVCSVLLPLCLFTVIMMIINVFIPSRHAKSPGKVQSAPVWNGLAHQPVYNSTKMHELDLTKEPSLPPLMFPFVLHPSIPCPLWRLATLPPSSGPPSAVFGKINGAMKKVGSRK